MAYQKLKEDTKVTSNGTQFIRFDLELSPEQFAKLDELCKECHRTRKNFSETLILLAISGQIDLTRLGIIGTKPQES